VYAGIVRRSALAGFDDSSQQPDNSGLT